MIPAQYYSYIYLLLVTILTIGLSNKYSLFPKSRLNSKTAYENNIIGYIIAITFSLFIGTRPFSYLFVDMMNYRLYYNTFYYGNVFDIDWGTENFIFDNLFAWCGANYLSIATFILVVAFGYFMLAFKAMTIFFRKDALYGFVVWLGAFSTFSYGTNGIKAGLAASIFLCALAYRYKPIKAVIFLLLSLGFHHSMMLPVAAYVVCFCISKPKYYFMFWIFSLFVALLHISFFQILFSSMADESGADYLTQTDEWGGKTGFRYDFVLYSAIPVVIGYYAMFKRGLQSKMYEFLYSTYLLTNGIWMLCMYASFTNRIAYLSWAFLPVVTMFPFFSKEFMPRQYSMANKVAWFQLAFTLAMNFIYYG